MAIKADCILQASMEMPQFSQHLKNPLYGVQASVSTSHGAFSTQLADAATAAAGGLETPPLSDLCSLRRSALPQAFTCRLPLLWRSPGRQLGVFEDKRTTRTIAAHCKRYTAWYAPLADQRAVGNAGGAALEPILENDHTRQSRESRPGSSGRSEGHASGRGGGSGADRPAPLSVPPGALTSAQAATSPGADFDREMERMLSKERVGYREAIRSKKSGTWLRAGSEAAAR